MTPRARVFAVVAAAAAVAAASVVGVTYLQTRGETTTAAAAPVTKARKGIPPLLFDFGVRNDAEVRDLARGAALLKQGKKEPARAIFSRYSSVQAQIGAAFSTWPDGSVEAVRAIVAAHPSDAVARLHLGIADYWIGRSADAVKQFQEVDARFPDTPSAVEAEDLLYADRFIPGLPYMVAPIDLPSAPTLAGQLERAKQQSPLVYGVMLWRLDRRVSARRALDAAAAAAPNDPLVLTLDAVSHFTKQGPVEAFGRLGPLTGRFPKSSVVRLHLGLLLVWQRQVQKGAKQLRLAMRAEPGSIYAKQAGKLLSALVPNGTK